MYSHIYQRNGQVQWVCTRLCHFITGVVLWDYHQNQDRTVSSPETQSWKPRLGFHQVQVSFSYQALIPMEVSALLSCDSAYLSRDRCLYMSAILGGFSLLCDLTFLIDLKNITDVSVCWASHLCLGRKGDWKSYRLIFEPTLHSWKKQSHVVTA